MKLRNKKTGEIVERSSIVTLKYKISSCSSSLVEAEEYSSIRQLNEDWEDYEPAEPLIKDEKIRKAVKAWAEACGVEEAYLQLETEEGSTFCVYEFSFNCDSIKIAFHDHDPIGGGRLYTIAELCGEGEE